MDERRIAELLLRNFGIRIEPEMSRYAQRQLVDGNAKEFAVLGGDSRTGIPQRKLIDANALRQTDAQLPT